MAYIVAVKRHHMRFFSTAPGDADKTGNLPAGLVVDRDVVHPHFFEFYIQ